MSLLYTGIIGMLAGN